MIWVGRAEKNYDKKGRRMMDGGADTSSDSICRGGNLPRQRREVLWQSWGGKSLNGQHWVAVIMGLTSTMSQKKVSDRQKPTEDIRIGRYEFVCNKNSYLRIRLIQLVVRIRICIWLAEFSLSSWIQHWNADFFLHQKWLPLRSWRKGIVAHGV